MLNLVLMHTDNCITHLILHGLLKNLELIYYIGTKVGDLSMVCLKIFLIKIIEVTLVNKII